MDRCSEYQALMLDYLYDLLDGEELQLLNRHLACCAHCQTALQEARGQRDLLAAAARVEFPQVQFQPPQPVHAAPAEPVILPLPAPRRRRPAVAWKRVAALAAAILVVLGLPGFFGAEYQAARQELTRHTRQQAVLREQLEESKTLLAALEVKKQHRLEALRDLLEERGLEIAEGEAFDTAKGTGGARKGVARADADWPRQDPKNRDNPEHKDNNQAQGAQANVEPQRGGRRGGVADRADNARAPDFLTYLQTDRPSYRPGQTIRVRSLTLERTTLRPAGQGLKPIYSLAPTGSTSGPERVFTPAAELKTLDLGQPIAWSYFFDNPSHPAFGVGAGEYDLPLNLEPGTYLVKVREAAERFPTQERPLVIQPSTAATSATSLQLSRSAYRPGEDVEAEFHITPAAGKGMRTQAEAIIEVEGREVKRVSRVPVDAQGRGRVRFRLPAQAERGTTVRVEVQQDGVRQTIQQSVPVVSDRLEVEFFPEGGRLVQGVENRVYFQARTPAGMAVPLQGRILDGEQVVARIRTLADISEPAVNQGRGSFQFTPQAGRNYRLAIDAPRGIRGDYPLPQAQPTGVALRVETPVTRAHEPIVVSIQGTGRDRALLAGLYCRGKLVAHQAIPAPAGQKVKFSLNPSASVGGVHRLVLFEDDSRGQEPWARLRPLAERLIYRQPREPLNLTVRTDRQNYKPGDEVRLQVQATDARKQPVPAVALVAVVDSAALARVEDRLNRSLPTFFLLTSEVRDGEGLEGADFLLTNHPRAGQALDLLLGVQVEPRFVGTPDLAALRQFALAQIQAVEQEVARERAAVEARRAQAEQQLQSAREDQTYRAVAARVDRYDSVLRSIQTAAPVLIVLLLIAGFVALGRAVQRPAEQAWPSLAGAGLALTLALGVGLLPAPPGDEPAQGTLVAAHKPSPALPGSEPKVQDASDENKRGDQAVSGPTVPSPAREKDKKVEMKSMDPASLPRAGSEASPPKAPIKPTVPSQPSPPSGGVGFMGGSGSGSGFAGGFGGGMSGLSSDGRAVEALKKMASRGYSQPPGQKTASPERALNTPRQNYWARTRSDLNRSKEAGDKPAALEDGLQEQRRRLTEKNGQLGKHLGLRLMDGYTHEKLQRLRQELDLTETICWKPALILPDGKATVSFRLGDLPTGWSVIAVAHTSDGRLSATTTIIDATDKKR